MCKRYFVLQLLSKSLAFTGMLRTLKTKPDEPISRQTTTVLHALLLTFIQLYHATAVFSAVHVLNYIIAFLQYEIMPWQGEVRRGSKSWKSKQSRV